MERIAGKKINSKGQAAITDALFFLMVVMSLVAFLFFFTSQYGRTVGEYSNSKYGSDYASSALKTILYSSFARDGLPLCDSEKEGCSQEVDYLIAAVKEDYADDKNINYFKENLTDSVKKVMQPVRNSFDYMLFIRVDAGAFEFPYFFLSRKEFTSTYDGVFVSGVEAKERNYYCNSSQASSFNQAKLDNFIVFIGPKGQSVSSISLPLAESSQPHEGIIQLVLWTSKDFNAEEQAFKNLDCKEIVAEEK